MRYFFISFVDSRTDVPIFGHWAHKAEKFPTENELRASVFAYVPKIKDPRNICILNIQELSEQDYMDFIGQ